MSRVLSVRQSSPFRSLAAALVGAKLAPFPRFITPCLATLRSNVPTGPAFVHELKLDGYRIQAHLREGRVTLYTRSRLDWSNRFPTIAADLVPVGGRSRDRR